MVFFRGGLVKTESLSQGAPQLFGGIALHGETTAGLRAFRRKSGDDQMATGFQSMLQLVQVPSLVCRIGEKVKHGPVMPDAVGSLQAGFQQIGFQPVDLCGPVSQARLGLGQRAGGNIQHAEVGPALVEKMIHQPRYTTPYIDELDYPPSSATRQPNLVASNPSDIGKPGFLL